MSLIILLFKNQKEDSSWVRWRQNRQGLLWSDVMKYFYSTSSAACTAILLYFQLECSISCFWIIHKVSFFQDAFLGMFLEYLVRSFMVC